MIELKVQITVDCDLISVQRLIKIHAGTFCLIDHTSHQDFISFQKAKSLKSKKEEGNTAFKAGNLEEAYKLYR